MGLFVNIEGNDGLSKKVVLDLVVVSLRQAGRSVAVKGFPDEASFTTGVLIDRFLRDGLALIDLRDTLFRREELRDLSDAAKREIAEVVIQKMVQVLFSVNRREGFIGERGVLELLEGHDIVLTGRWLSAYAYGIAGGASRLQISAIEGELRQPDRSFLLELDPSLARARRERRGVEADRNEADEAFMARVRDVYHELVREDATEAEQLGREPRIVRIDAAASQTAIATEIVGRILAGSGTPDTLAAARFVADGATRLASLRAEKAAAARLHLGDEADKAQRQLVMRLTNEEQAAAALAEVARHEAGLDEAV